MVVSSATTQALAILRRYLDKTTLREVLLELAEVPGNQSWHDTLLRLRALNDRLP